MTFRTPPNPAGFSLRRLAWASAAILPLTLSGCLGGHTRAVPKLIRATNVLDATLAQLNTQIAARNAAVQTINAAVEIQASTGGEHEGEVKEKEPLAGYILMRRPTDMRVFMLLPVVRSLAMDMVSDGKDFKLYIPSQSKAIAGSDAEVASPSKNGLENLRPYIIRDALLVPAVGPDELVSLTTDFRILPPAQGRKEATEEPDYDLTISRKKTGNELQTIRVIHLSRVTLKPYRQDIYDPEGRQVTVVLYDKYQKFGDVDFPMSILITRPRDEYSLRVDVTKLTLNQKLDDEQFVLKIPENIPVTKM